MYGASQTDLILNATLQFHKNSRDPKSQIITHITSSPSGPTTLVLFFHDGPRKPTVFRHFDGIPSAPGMLRARLFVDFVKFFPAEMVKVSNLRGAFATMSTSKLTARFLEAIRNETAVRSPSQIDTY